MVKGLLATPAGTAAAVLQRLEAETQKALATPAFKERMAVLGATPGLPTSAQFTRVIQDKNQALGAQDRGDNRPAAVSARARARTIRKG
jgi:tripartite-type tricarboxylate transporter receptor subunit TctC